MIHTHAAGGAFRPDRAQAIADAEEATISARYDDFRALLDMVGDAARRADAMLRLESTLRYAWVRPPAAH